MKEFSKKTDCILLALSIFFLIFGSIVILFSNNFVYILKDFIQNVVFHEEFDIEPWFDTLLSIFMYPMFCVLFVDAVLFVKFRKQTKIIILTTLFIITGIFITFVTATRSMDFMDYDMSSEILLAKECWLQKSFIPRSWYYSTEIRLLNTQLISAPIFAFTNNWVVVKSITVIIISLLYSLSLWFLLSELEIKELWIKMLSCLLIFSPWSMQLWQFVLYGSYYMPHISISFVFIGLFFGIFNNNYSAKKHRTYKILYWLLAFYSGLSSIRYIIYFVFPLAFIINFIAISNLSRNKIHFEFRKYFIDDRKVFYSTLALFVSGFGYICNSFVLAKFYSFSNFNMTALKTIGSVKFVDFYAGILDLFGYKNEVSVLTPSGLSDLLLYVALIFFVICLVHLLRKKEFQGNQKLFLMLTVVILVFDSFVYIKTEFIIRYFLLLVPYIIPCFAIIISNSDVPNVKKWILGTSLSVTLLTNSFYTFETTLNYSNTTEKKAVTKFLLDNNYTFGYGTFYNANVFTYLSNGKIEVGNLYKKDIDNQMFLIDEYKYDTWLTPKRYYSQPDSLKNVFLILDAQEYKNNINHNSIKNGKCIYDDGYYYVFLYDTLKDFKESFDK